MVPPIVKSFWARGSSHRAPRMFASTSAITKDFKPPRLMISLVLAPAEPNMRGGEVALISKRAHLRWARRRALSQVIQGIAHVARATRVR